MRINDKHLMGFASSNAPVDKCGFMMKRGEMNKAFQRRWFVLKGNLLFYYEKKGDRDPIGVIILEGCTIELATSQDAFAFEISYQGAGSRTYVLNAESQECMESWMKALACAGYDYMKVMVAELQRQLDEVNASKNGRQWASSLADGAKSKNVDFDIDASNGAAGPRVSSQRGQGLLVDLSVPDSPAKHSQQSRHNPFNEMDEDLDLFGAVPFSTVQKQQKAKGPREFEEMHEEFGFYINKKMREISVDR